MAILKCDLSLLPSAVANRSRRAPSASEQPSRTKIYQAGRPVTSKTCQQILVPR